MGRFDPEEMNKGQGKDLVDQNGNIYSGDILWIKNGNGKCKYNTKDGYEIYEGQFREDLCHGKGKYIFANGEIYEGDFSYGGERMGNCTVKYPNGNEYNGKWSRNSECGKGTMKYKNGDIYIGNWDSNNQNGQGKMKYKNGDYYDGNWSSGKPSGKGEMIYANGDIYEGEWKNGVKSEKGRMIYANGDIYTGEWKKDEKNGRGEMIYSNHIIKQIKGNWQNNTFDTKNTNPIFVYNEDKIGIHAELFDEIVNHNILPSLTPVLGKEFREAETRFTSQI